MFLFSNTVMLRCMWTRSLMEKVTISTKEAKGVLDEFKGIVSPKDLRCCQILGDDLSAEGGDKSKDLRVSL